MNKATYPSTYRPTNRDTGPRTAHHASRHARRTLGCHALCLLLLGAPLAAADATLQFEDGSVIQAKDGRARIGDEGSFMLYEGDEGSILSVDADERSYFRMSESSMNEIQAASKAMIDAQMEEALAALPPEQRDAYRQQMEAMLASQGMMSPAHPDEKRIRATGGRSEVSGFGCQQYDVISVEDDTVEQQLCVATADELGISQSDFDTLAAAMKAMITVSGAMHEMDLEKLDGIPVRMADEDGETNLLVDVSTETVPPARVTVPDGYREVSPADMMRQ